MDWHYKRCQTTGSMGCKFDACCDHFSIHLTALGKLLTTNVHPLDLGDECVHGQGEGLTLHLTELLGLHESVCMLPRG